MNDIRRVLKLAFWRLYFIDLLRAIAIVATIAIFSIALTRITQKIFGLESTFAPLWPRIFAYAGAGVFAAALLWATLIRRRSLAVARVLDERAGLRESLSTALCVERSTDPWAVAVVETAVARARGVKVGAAIPIEAPRLWPVPIGAALALFILWISLPQIDVLGYFKKEQAAAAKEHEAVVVKAERAEEKKKLDDLLAKAKVKLEEEPATPGQDNPNSKEIDPEAIRRIAVKQLTDMAEKLQGLKDGDKAAQADAMKEAMRQLKQPGDGPLNDLAKAMSKGDFNKAQASLEQLNKQLADGALSPQQKEAMKEQLQNLSKQLDKLGKEQEQVAKKLQNAGLDKKTAEELAKKAGDPEALKKALEEMKNLSPEQQQQLMKMAKAMGEACKNAGEMGEAMAKMAEGMTQEGMQQEGMEGMEALKGELSNAEMMQSDMENLDAAMTEAKAQLAKLGQCLGGKCSGDGDGDGEPHIGQYSQGDKSGSGNGSGGPGHGNGPVGEEMPADFTMDKVKTPSQTTQGPIIGTRLVYGDQVKGDSKAQFSQVVEASSKAATESIDGMQIPREYHDAVKHYFGKLKEKADGPAKPAAPTTPKTPTTDAKDAPKK